MTAGAFLLALAVFYVYTYNSGYGYDSFEYLAVGQSLLDGFRISSFALSKGWAMYALSAAVLAICPASNHAWLSLVITLLFGLAVTGTWWAGRRLFGSEVAVWSAGIVAVCAFFMELNFLEPEIPVYLCGLLAAFCLESDRLRLRTRSWLAGLCLGAGFAFKAVALLYLAGLCGYLLYSRRRRAPEAWRSLLWIVAGFGVALLLPAAYFAATRQLGHHVEWSLVFPLLHYPANTIYLHKLYTKLLWFFLALGGAAWLAASPALRPVIFANPRVPLVLWLGGVSLLSLLKTQPSHYVFPGAAFLSFFLAHAFRSWLRHQAGARATSAGLAAGLLVVAAASAYSYRPIAFRRFLEKRDFGYEQRLAAGLQRFVGPQDRALFVHGGAALYWVARRYPNVPALDTHVQTTYLLFRQPDLFVAALDDPRLKLVEFDPDRGRFHDPAFLKTEHHRKLMRQFFQRLQEGFRRVPGSTLPEALWIRRTAAD